MLNTEDLITTDGYLSFCIENDTHRLWKTLYMDSIPIVKYESAHHLFTDLPILFINDWKEINLILMKMDT